MTKKEMFALAEKYGMTLNTHPVTGEPTTYTKETETLIPELDEYADIIRRERVQVTRTLAAGVYRYTIYIPSGWA